MNLRYYVALSTTELWGLFQISLAEEVLKVQLEKGILIRLQDCMWWSAWSPVSSVVCWSSSAHSCNFAPQYQLIRCFSWFKNYSWHILPCQKEFASWGKSKEEARCQREAPSLPLELGAKPLIALDVRRTTAGQNEMWKPRKKGNAGLQSGQVCCISKDEIWIQQTTAVWRRAPRAGESVTKCGRPCELAAATGARPTNKTCPISALSGP